MKVLDVLKGIIRFVLLFIAYFICYTISAVLVGMQGGTVNQPNDAMFFAVFCLLNAGIAAVFILNSRHTGLRLAGITAAVMFGVQTFMSQVETLVFNSAIQMPLPFLAKVVGLGLLHSVMFSLLAVLILGRFRKDSFTLSNNNRRSLGKKDLLMNILGLSIFYVAIYLVFGYFVAWQFPAVRQFYTGSTDIVSFFAQIKGIITETPYLLLIQLIRGAIWTLLALLIITALRTGRYASSIITGLLFAVLLASPLLFTNIYMPGPVRFGHSIELATSMLVFGAVCGLRMAKSNITNLRFEKKITY